MMDKIGRMSEKHHFAAIGVIALLTLVMITGIPKIRTEVEMRTFLPQDYPSVRATLEIENKFGETRYEFILVKSENVARADVIKSLLGLQRELLAEPNLKNYIIGVESYLDLLLPQITVENRLLPDEQLEPKIQSLLAQPEIYVQTVGTYITHDQRACLLSIKVNPDLESKEARVKTLYFEDFVKNYASESGILDVSITGEYSISKDTSDVVGKETRILLIAITILIVIILSLAFRRFSDVVSPFVVLGLSTTWVAGIMGHFGILFSSVAFAIPTILFGVCVSYTFHMIYRYREERSKGYSSSEAVVPVVKTTGTAVFFAAVTTAVGFGSWMVSDILPLRDFGLLCGLGVLLSFIFTVTLLPAFWAVRDKKGNARKAAGEYRISGRIKSGLGRKIAKVKVERHPRKVAIAIGIGTFVAIIFATQTTTAIQFDKLMPTGVESIETADEVRKHFQDPTDACIVMVKGDVNAPATLGAMIQLERQVVFEDPRNVDGIVSYSFSIADLVLVANDWSLPENSTQAKAILENLRQRYPKINMMVTPDNLAAVIVFIGETETDADLKLMTDIIRDQAKQVDPTAKAEFSVGGMPAISADLLSKIPEDAFKIALVTFVAVAIILCLIFRSPEFGLVSMMPICLALVWEFGAFYAFGIPLNLITVLISALLIGIGIDFSIHLTHRYMEELKNSPGEPEGSMRSAIFHVGGPISVATATTCGAFALLIISRIPAIGTFGLMTALVILFCLIATLFVLPPVLVSLSRRIEEKDDLPRLK